MPPPRRWRRVKGQEVAGGPNAHQRKCGGRCHLGAECKTPSESDAVRHRAVKEAPPPPSQLFGRGKKKQSVENISISHTVRSKEKGLKQPGERSGLELCVFRFSSRKTSDIRNASRKKAPTIFAASHPTLYLPPGFCSKQQ